MASSFCTPIGSSLTDTELSASFGSSATPGIVPNGGFPQSAHGDDGLLTPAFLASIVSSLQSQGTLPTAPKTDNKDKIAQYIQNMSVFSVSLKTEYCFYDARYRYSLQQLINILSSSYGASGDTNTAIVQNYLKSTQLLNQKLNDLCQVINQIAKNMYESTIQMDSSVQIINNQIAVRAKKLQAQADIIRSNQGAANLYKEMIKYTEEKVNVSNNLLNMYTFLNVFILGMLIYLYRSSSTST